jgi:condensin complex subunit 1
MRKALATALSMAVTSLCNILKSYNAFIVKSNAGGGPTMASVTVPQEFRDTFACHLYMLYTFMFFMESDMKGNSKVTDDVQHMRQVCADAMVIAAQTATKCRSTLWKLGVPDESVIVLPCRIAYPMLEAATGVIARKATCADQAIRMIAITTQATDSLLSTVTAALMDLMSSFEHMASITVDICNFISSNTSDDNHTPSNTTNNRLAVELLREIGRLDVTQESKSVGIKYIAPFISGLAESQPRLVLRNLSHILLHLQSEPYALRSSIITATSYVLEYLGKQQHSAPSDVEDGSDESSNLLDTTKTRTALLDILTERVYDISSYTRASALKAWIRLCQTQSIPKEQIIVVTRLAMDRLQDKTVVVRKQSMQLLTLLLENNPYQGNLNPEPYRMKLAELYEYIKENMPKHIAEAQRSNIENDDVDDIQELERAALAAAIAEADIMMSSSIDDMNEADKVYCAKVQALKFTQSALDFIDQFEDATQALEGMLLSSNNSDVTEALRFFVQARHFGLPCAVTGMKRALALMWSTEPSIREEVIKAFIEVFIAVPGTDGKKYLPHDDIAKNLLVLISQASVSELASIEEAIICLVTEERLPDDLFLILWSYASKGNLDTRACSLQLISMGAGADRTIIDSKSRLKLLLDTGLGAMYESTSTINSDDDNDAEGTVSKTNSKNHWKLGRAAAICLQRIERAQVDPTDAKYLVLERIIEELSSICQGDMCSDENKDDTMQWFSTAEQAIKALFVISPAPELICRHIIVQMYQTTFSDDKTSIHSLRLARFFHILGQIAISLLVYTEALSGSVRRGNARLALKKQEEADKAKRTSNNEDNEDAIEAELGVAAEAEAENERRLTDIVENEIVGRNLLSMFGPLLIRVVGNDGGKYNSEILAQASTLALCKFMCVSSQFCEKHLPLLFTALANAPPDDTTMRANTVIALGDLAFRFPNEVEPYTPRMYACLRDSSIKVRRHTLMVLTHLILNDMVKVKGQVCEIALCLRDEDSRIRDMSRLLFHELSKRSNNPIYNLLPEIISQLSQMSIATDEFRSILTFLLGFIKKERQNEMLMEKLCQRFTKCTTTEQAADLAYCVAQLKLTEKSIKCLSDSFNLYKNSLYDEHVNKSFHSIVVKAKKFMKPERKQLIEEWEAKLNEFALVGMENQKADENAAKSKKRAAKKQQTNVPISTHKKDRTRRGIVDDDEVDDELDFPEDVSMEGNRNDESNDNLIDSDDDGTSSAIRNDKNKSIKSSKVMKSKKTVKVNAEKNKENAGRRPRRVAK